MHRTTRHSNFPNSFGSIMEGRSYEGDSSLGYRFGFNGKEKDDQTYGEGNEMDFGGRIYNSSLGRWLAIDPLQAQYQSLSPYGYCSNTPIYFIDQDGKEHVLYIAFLTNVNNGKSVYSLSEQKEILYKAQKQLNDQGINVKVIGVETDHRFNIGLLDKTDDVVYVGNTTQINNLLPKLSTPAQKNKGDVGLELGGEEGYSDHESYCNTDEINTFWHKPEFNDPTRRKLQKENREKFDNEGVAAIFAVHESIGHNVTDYHRNQWTTIDGISVEDRPNTLCDGDQMHLYMEPFPFDQNSDFLRFLPEDLSVIKAKYQSPLVPILSQNSKPNESRGCPTTDPNYYHDSYTKGDSHVKKIND